MKRTITVGLLLLFAGIYFTTPSLSAVDLTSAGRKGPAADEAALREGMDLYAAGEAEAALSLLRAFVDGHVDSPLLTRAYLYLGRIHLDSDRPGEALQYLGRIPAEQQGPEARLATGAALVALGEDARGTAMLRELEGIPLSEPDQTLRFSALGEGNARLGRPLQALVFLHRGLALPAGRQEEGMRQMAHDLLAERLDDQELAEAAFMFRGAPIGEDAVLQQALRAEAGGEEAKALRLVETIVASSTPFPYRAQAAALWERLTGQAWLQRAVGVMLPQSGRFAAYGELVRRGMELAQEIHDQNNPPVRFLFRDTGADPEACGPIVSELANQGRVMAIAGPLTGGAAVAAADRAQQERVSLLTLSPREGLPMLGDFVFRNSLTSRLQAQALARYAMEEKGMSAFGVLYPDNKLGRELAELFAAEVLRRGGLVVARESYAGEATDFGRQIKLLRGVDPNAPEEENTPRTEKERRENLNLPDEPTVPAVNFDALFIPDDADRISLIAPQLAYYGIEDIPLLGINAWNSQELVRQAGRFVEGAVFVDGFFRYSPYPFVEDFVRRYYEKYGQEPSILEAQGFDVANILLTLLDRPEVQSREALRLALSQLKNYPGVTGGTTFNLQGDTEKVLFLLQIQNGNIVQIN